MTNNENLHDRLSGSGPPRPPSRPARRALIAILATFALLGAVYSVTVPIFEASDELWHYPMVEVIARTWQLPVQPLEPGTSSGPWRQEGSQPPLYYALSAALTAWIDTQDLLTVWQPNPHTRAGEITPERDNANLVLHDAEVERFPWRGTVLAVHLVRFFSVALGGPVTYFGRPLAYAHRGRGIERRHLQRFTEHLLATLEDRGLGERDVHDVIERINVYSSDILGGHGTSG